MLCHDPFPIADPQDRLHRRRQGFSKLDFTRWHIDANAEPLNCQ